MNQDITATLLPTARVDFYVLDDATAATAGNLASDWRFARVAMQVTKAGIEAAITNYSQYASPDMIIIETNDISDNFIAQLGQLAGVCAAGTDAVIVGPMNDVHLYRSLVGMGVRDYLVRPLAADDLVKVIAKAVVDKHGLTGARLISVIGAKGGVGATAIAQAIASCAADKLKQKTMLMDAAGSAGSLGISFGIEPTISFTEALRIGASGTEDDMKRITQSLNEQLSLIVCGGEPVLMDPPNADAVEALVNRVMQKYPVVVLDLSGATPDVQKRLMTRATHAIIVSTPILTSLRNCRTLMNEMRNLRAGMPEPDVIINMRGAAGSDEVSAKDVKAALDFEPTATLAYSPKIFVGSELSGKPVAQNKAAAELLKPIDAIARRATGASDKANDDSGKKDSAKGGILKMLKGK
jgi:pilus assembly protein CpaE